MKPGTAKSENGIHPPLRLNPNVLVIAYLLHLVLPAFLFLDVITAWRRGLIAFEPWGIDTAIAGLSALWLVAGLGALFLSGDRQGFVGRIYKPLLSIYVVYLMLIFIEVFAQTTIQLPPPIRGMLSPGRRQVGPYDPNIYPGLHGMKTVTVNRLGLRGPMPPKQGSAYRILAIGGSTTICQYLDDSEEWPHVLMEEMNASQKSHPVWVGNAGINGFNTVHHLVLLQWLPGVVHADMVIFLVGGNDLGAALAFDGAPTQTSLETYAGFQGDLPQGTLWRSSYPLYRRLQLFRLIRLAALILERRFGHSEFERRFQMTLFRERRKAAPVVAIPDLHTGLEEYRGRLLALARRCRVLELRCLFLTQPSMWRSDLSPAEESLLWMPYVGRWENPRGTVTAADMGRAMDAYNRALLDVCRQNGLECYDLASYLPKDTSVFIDDVHFNEAGSRLVAQILKQYLLSQSPFGEPVKSSGTSLP